MLDKESILELERQQYRVVGENTHSAVKVCGWTKKMIKGEGGCYKLKFYGIKSNQCMQMTTSISCANRCSFCWRGYKAPVAKEWDWGVDEPEDILKESLSAHKTLLSGFKGHPRVNMPAYKKSDQVEHVALSLTGEPIMYPKMNGLIEKFHSQGISTFLVTNAQYPDQIRDLKPITQLYISLDAPNKKLLKEIDVPLFTDYWERLNKSLDYLKEKKSRTAIRITAIKGLNMCDEAGYASLIAKGDPDFIEVKAYMFIGASRDRLSLDNMPYHEEVVEWTQKLLEFLPDYETVTDHVASRVVLLAKKKFKVEGQWMTWIDFPKFIELANSGSECDEKDYRAKTPKVGLSGKTTQDYATLRASRKVKV